MRRPDLQRADLHHAALVDLLDGSEAPKPDQAPETLRHDDSRRAVEEPQRSQVEVVVVGVRDQHRVDVPEAFDSRIVGSPQVRHPSAEQRGREQSRPVQLDEDGLVADRCHGVRREEYARGVEGTAVRASRGRMIAAWILVFLAIVVALLALIAGYVRYQALDTPTVRDTAEQMIADPQIRE